MSREQCTYLQLWSCSHPSQFGGMTNPDSCDSCELWQQERTANAPAMSQAGIAIDSKAHVVQDNACVHRGSKRRCCDELYLCKKFPGESCTPGASSTPGLRSCLTCDLFEPVTNEAA